jgi:hypothetical protein
MVRKPDIGAIKTDSEGGSSDTTAITGAAAQRIVSAAVDGAVLSRTARADADAAISLKGLKAALRYMDEVQGRAGTVTALVANGTRAASAVPEPVLPLVEGKASGSKAELDEAGVKAVVALHRRVAPKDRCEDEILKDAWTVENREIEPGIFLISVSCWWAAYQGGQSLYLADRRKGLRILPAPVDGWTKRPARSLSGAIWR